MEKNMTKNEEVETKPPKKSFRDRMKEAYPDVEPQNDDELDELLLDVFGVEEGVLGVVVVVLAFEHDTTPNFLSATAKLFELSLTEPRPIQTIILEILGISITFL